MQRHRTLHAPAFLFLAALSLGTTSEFAESWLQPVPRANLCVTEGELEELPGDELGVSVPKMRAYLNAMTPQSVEAQFKYLGSTGNEARLGSGELRRQFGLKLRARRLQPGLCDVAHRAGIEAGGFREEQSRSAQQRGVRQSRIPKHQGASQQTRSGPAARQRAYSSRGNEWRRDEGLRRQRAGLGRLGGFRSAGLRRAGGDSFRQRPSADQASLSETNPSTSRTRAGLPHRSRGIRMTALAD
jgi:hypothetical protein